MGDLQKVGVEAVVENLGQFTGDMNSINSQLKKLAGQPTLIQQGFSALGNVFESVFSGIARIAEYTIGNLLAGAIRGTITWVQDLAKETIDAGNQFQTLRLRLETLNFNAAIESGKNFNAAMAESVRVTAEQLDWLQKLAAQTPYDNTDISNVYTLARSYQFTDEKARSLTEAVTNFTAGMGLGSDVLERVITNLGQMQMQGKITGTELRDLARGAFVPVADVLDRVAKSMEESGAASASFADEIATLQSGISDYEGKLAIAVQKQSEFTDKTKESEKMTVGKAIDDYRQKIADLTLQLTAYNQITDGTGEITKEMFAKMRKEGIPASEFINSFIDMVNTKFPDASKKMARTFGAATDNLKDMVKSIGGLQIVTPILDVLGAKIAAINDSITGDRWDKLKSAAQGVGDALSGIVSALLDLLPSGTQVADVIIKILDEVSAWLTANQDNIVNIAKSIVDWFSKAFQEIGKTDWGGLLQAILGVGTAILTILGIDPSKFSGIGSLSEIIAGVITWLNNLSAWLINNKDIIGVIVKIFVGWEIIQTVINLFAGLVIQIGLFLLGVAGTIKLVSLFIAGLLKVVGALLVVAAVVLSAIAIFLSLKLVFEEIQLAILTLVNFFKTYFAQILPIVQKNIDDIKKAWQAGDWGGLAVILLKAFANGLVTNVNFVIDAFKTIGEAIWASLKETFANFNWADLGQGMVDNIVNTVKNALGIKSPSKVFADIGNNIVAGMAKGIADANKLAQTSMSAVVNTVVSTATPAPAMVSAAVGAGNTTTNTTNNNANYNLTVNSSARTEPIIADFGMLQSLAGV